MVPFLLLLCGVTFGVLASERGEDAFTTMWWQDGPPHYHTMQGPAPAPVLCLVGTEVGIVMDTRSLAILHAGRFRTPQTREGILRDESQRLQGLAPAKLLLEFTREGRVFRCTGRGAEPKDEFLQPVRFVESGRFFQRVAIEGLEFVDEHGDKAPHVGRLEIALWPDRLSFTAEVLPGSYAFDGELRIALGKASAAVPLSQAHRVTLEAFPKGAKAVAATIEADPALTVSFDAELGCHTLALPEQPWSNAKGTYYPEEHLDRLDRWRFRVANDSGREVTARLMFVQRHHLPITGFTPMLCDSDGTPSGIPVQISKNWHQRPDKGTLAHEGPWFHGSTLVRLPAKSQREFLFQMVYARYGGVPAASHAQLSLIGWGHNQFWDESALGSFGESICYEPGRVQRRCMIDDIRPLMTLPVSGGKPWGWAENCGGGDFLVWIDSQGKYRGSRATRSDYRSYGPCLTDVRYLECTRGGEIRAEMEVSLARSDDYLRAFHRFRYDVKSPITWQRLAFYQLGADFYNETPANRVAIGDADGIHTEWRPPHVRNTFDRTAVPLTGLQPWVSIHGVDRSQLPKGTAAASRGLIVRSWKAVLGGKPAPTPHLSTFGTEWGKGNFKTTLELAPPPEVKELQAGDFVEAEVELVVFPSDANAYYGNNRQFRAALQTDADTWRLVHQEAGGNALRVTARRGTVKTTFPLRIASDRRERVAVTIDGGSGWIPLTISGLRRHTGYHLAVNGKLLDQSVHGRDFWQTDYDTTSRRWIMTFNVPRTSNAPLLLEFGPEANP